MIKLYRRGRKKSITTNFDEKKATFKTQNFCILLEFLLITKALLVAFSIYCYLTKFLVKQKHILPLHVKNNKLKEFYSGNTN